MATCNAKRPVYVPFEREDGALVATGAGWPDSAVDNNAVHRARVEHFSVAQLAGEIAQEDLAMVHYSVWQSPAFYQ